jgi:hypothetical protein
MTANLIWRLMVNWYLLFHCKSTTKLINLNLRPTRSSRNSMEIQMVKLNISLRRLILLIIINQKAREMGKILVRKVNAPNVVNGEAIPLRSAPLGNRRRNLKRLIWH